jgi:hypothetical protein
MADLNKGGRLNAKVVAVGKSSFTVKVDGKGHEHHDAEIELPASHWNGPGAVCGPAKDLGYPKLDADNPRSTPKGGESVIFDADAYAKSQSKASESKPVGA